MITPYRRGYQEAAARPKQAQENFTSPEEMARARHVELTLAGYAYIDPVDEFVRGYVDYVHLEAAFSAS